MSLPIILIGEVVLAKETCQGPDPGYLQVSKGEKLEVLYVGAEGREDAAWIYAKRLEVDPQSLLEGWISRDSVELCRKANDVVIAATSGSTGQLQYSEGDRLKVKQWGRPENEREQNQIFVEKQTGEAGWISLTEIQRLECSGEETQRVWRQVLCEQDLIASPCLGEEKAAAGFAVYEKLEVSVPNGLVVEVLELKEDWAKVLLRQHICGWMPSENLSREPAEEPPPPPQGESKLAAAVRPPKPARAAPRAKQAKQASQLPTANGKEAAPTAKRVEAVAESQAPEAKPVVSTPVPAPPAPSAPLVSPAVTPVKATVEEDLPGSGSVHVATFGLECLDGELADRCHELGDGAHAIIPEPEIAEALQRRKFPSDVILDARMFPDPDAALLTRHSGRHHLIITRLCQHRNFGGWLQNAKSQFRQALHRQEKRGIGPMGPKISVAVYCRRGKHRSVAAACILKHIFLTEGFRCPEISHLSYAHWRNCCKMQCAECLQPPEELQVQLHHAYKHWSELP